MVHLSRVYYIFKDCNIKIKENTVSLITKDEKTTLPIEDIDEIFLFGSGSITTGVLNKFKEYEIILHIFGKYENYIGSFLPKKTNLSGEIMVRQVENYLNKDKRLFLAKQFVMGAAKNYNSILKKKKYETIDLPSLDTTDSIPQVMSEEGRFKSKFYEILDAHLEEKYRIKKRTRRPPENFANAIISFLNSLTYSVVAGEIYKTHLNPEISYLHEPFERRLSLSLDVAEIFKPILSENIFLNLHNLKQIDADLWFSDENGVFLSEYGKKAIVKEFDEYLSKKVKMRKNNMRRSVKYLIRMELFKLEKHLLEIEEYKPLHMWW